MRTISIREMQALMLPLALVLVGALTGCATRSTNTAVSRIDVGELGEAVPMPPITMITAELIREQRALRERQIVSEIGQLTVAPTKYVIDAGDVLSIVVWDHPELTAATMVSQATGVLGTDSSAAGFVVNHDGMVQFPYAGELVLAGLTEEQARNLLTTRLERYINKPKVTLRVQSHRSKRVYIDGEVKSPGLQTIDDIPMTVIEAINRAGGLLPTGDQSQITVNRGGILYKLNLLRLVQKGINPASLMLVNGDVVRVMSRDESKVFVSGEVTMPKALTMHNGHLTLNEALGESGGVNATTGDGRQVFVVRKSANGPAVYRLDASEPGAMATAEEFELDPKDVVYVAPTALANWHRGISLIFPSALTSLTGPIR